MFRTNFSKEWIKKSIALSFVAAIVGQAQSSYAINFRFDYTYDDNSSNKFFDSGTTLGQSRRATLNEAATYFSSFTDNLSAINPSGNNTWTPKITNPVTGTTNESVSGLQNISANEIVVFVGARDLDGSLGLGGPGSSSISYEVNPTGLAFKDTVKARGQSGALNSPATDFGPWGGSLSFDNTVTWNSDLDAPASNENDLLSVAIHELGHLMGAGTAPSWDSNISGSDFTGTNSVAAFGGNVPLSTDGAHWADGTTSTVNGISQETAMDPTITEGTRKLFTQLDYAGLKDVGWETASVPFEFSPGLGMVLVGGLYGLNKAKKMVLKK
jgi:hypothetical protein